MQADVTVSAVLSLCKPFEDAYSILGIRLNHMGTWGKQTFIAQGQ